MAYNSITYQSEVGRTLARVIGTASPGNSFLGLPEIRVALCYWAGPKPLLHARPFVMLALPSSGSTNNYMDYTNLPSSWL
jgi:hypothetical protein